MSVDYILHIYDSGEAPLEEDDILFLQSRHFFPEYQEVLNRYTIEELGSDPVKLADAQKDFQALEEKTKQLEADYLKRWLLPDGTYPNTEWRQGLNAPPWDAWSLAYHRVCQTPQFNLGSDDGGYKSSGLVAIENVVDGRLFLITNEFVEKIGGEALVLEDWTTETGTSTLLSEFLDRYKGHYAFIITH